VKNLILILFSFLFFPTFNAQELYSKDYGKKENPAIIFIHGGPSGNSNLFEATTAKKLADLGFYVIVYDRRGEGRSKDENATMTFNESIGDLLNIYKIYNIGKANILAHSFGGIIATLFTEKHPEKVKSLILAGALFSQQETYNHILSNAEEKFKGNPEKLVQILKTKQLSKNSADYRKQCYELASEMDNFDMPNPTPESKNLRENYLKSDFYKTNFRNHDSPIKFYQNESRNNLNNKKILKETTKNLPVYAIYGKQDGIFSSNQLKDLEKIAGTFNLKILDNCSHYLFVDQQADFIEFISQKLSNSQ
jgi:proline iminopeptidase